MSDDAELDTADAEVWARAFMATFAGHYIAGEGGAVARGDPRLEFVAVIDLPDVVSEGTMIGWFANAIERGHDAKMRTTPPLSAWRLEAALELAVARCPSWFPDVWTAKSERSIAVHHALELGSEAGEVLGEIKRLNRVDGARAAAVRSRLPELLAAELADVLMNVAVLASLFDVDDLAEAVRAKVAVNDARFPAALNERPL